VKQRDRVAEAVDEARHGLRREADLRHEHDHPAPALQRVRGGLEIDLRLAGSGYAEQQP